MEKKIEVAFIYKPCKTLSKDYYFTHANNFFIHALKRHKQLTITYYQTKEIFDINDINPDTKIILLPENANTASNDSCMPNEIKNIDKTDIPILARVGDPYAIKKSDIMNSHNKYNITAYFSYQPELLFRKYYGQKFKFKTVLWGIENSLYDNLIPFNNRIKTNILNSGALAPTKYLSKLVHKYFRAGDAVNQYKLRTLCNNLPYVDYTPTLEHEYVGDNYPKLLQKYTASIAATSYCYTTKYLEIPAAGCLTFMEVTDTNYAKDLGFKDDETAIFINEKNYQSKFEEYLNDIDNKKWEDISNSGREFVMNNLTNEHAVNNLVELMTELIN